MNKLAWLGLLLLGCGERALPSSPACLQQGSDCMMSSQCCSGFCQAHNAYVRDWHTCSSPVADGDSCFADGECQSRHCVDYRCGKTNCAGGDGTCQSDGDCCAGYWCNNETYARWTCRPLSSAGAYCTTPSHCSSGQCNQAECAP